MATLESLRSDQRWVSYEFSKFGPKKISTLKKRCIFFWEKREKRALFPDAPTCLSTFETIPSFLRELCLKRKTAHVGEKRRMFF